MRSMRLSRYGGGSTLSRGSGCQGFLEKGWLPRRVAGQAGRRGLKGTRKCRERLAGEPHGFVRSSGQWPHVVGSRKRVEMSVSWRSLLRPPQNAVIAVIALKSP